MPIRRPRSIEAPLPGCSINWDDGLARGLRYVFPFTEGAGQYSAEATGHQRGSFNQLSIWASGPKGGHAIRGLSNSTLPAASYFDTKVPNLNFPSATIVWWQYPTSPYNDGTWRSSWGINSPTQSLTGTIYSDNNWTVGWYGTPNGQVVVAASPTNYPQNKWSMYAITWTPTGSAFYMNGAVLLGTSAVAPPIADLGSPLYIGITGAQNPQVGFPGKVANFQVWARVLRSSELSALYAEPWRLYARSRRRGLAPVVAATQAQLTQIALEQWAQGTPQAWLTQAAIEQWASVAVVVPPTQGPRVMVMA